MAGPRVMLEEEEIKKIQCIPTQQQLADCLTKQRASSKKLLQALKGQGTPGMKGGGVIKKCTYYK